MTSRINKFSGVVLSRLIKPGMYADGGGLWLRVSGAAARSWVFRYAIRGKRHEMGLGSVHTVDLATARAKARAFRQLLLDGKDPLAVHGFRSTFRDWCAECGSNSFAREVCEHALAHGLPDKTEAAYQRGDLLEKRVKLMQAWAHYCYKRTPN